MATWPPWRTRCRAHSSQTGRPCRAWAVTGCPTCVAHGSGTRKAKAAGLARVEAARVRDRLLAGIIDGMRQWDAMTPQQRQEAGRQALRIPLADLEAELAAWRARRSA